MNAEPEFTGVIETLAAGVENIFAKRRTKVSKRRVSVPNVSANFQMQMMVSRFSYSVTKEKETFGGSVTFALLEFSEMLNEKARQL